MKKKVIVFCDFDGVCHPFFPEQAYSDAENSFFSYVPNIEKAVTENLDNYDIKIVISSSWRYSHTLERMKAYFPESLSSLMIDMTPHVIDSYTTREYNREDECRAWINQNDPDCAWFAMDDDKHIFYTPEKLLWCPNHFKDDQIKQFKEMLETC